MNKQELSGNVSKISGKIKEKAGEIMEDEELQTEGKVQYLSGMIMEFYGNKKSAIFKSLNGMIDSVTKLKGNQPKPVEIKK